MAAEDPCDLSTQPEPSGGWSEQIETLEEAIVVPPLAGGFVQPAGVLNADGAYCRRGALWRKYRALTVEPVRPDEVPDRLTGRWLWGGVLWAHFGHFMVESTARLWAAASASPLDGILFMPRRPKAGEAVRGFHEEVIDQFAPGVPVHVAVEPTRVETLIVPGQGFGLGRITVGTPAFRAAVRDRFGAGIAADGPDRLYISRSGLGVQKGGLLGEERLETLLGAEGYEIFHPERHDIATQIARYKAATRIVAADGSALHLFAMVGRADQHVAVVMRRRSTANNLLALNLSEFCGRDPLLIHALHTEWLRADKQRSNRLSFGELDHPAIGAALASAGFVSDGQWPAMNDDEHAAEFEEKGLGRKGRFIEAPSHVRRRIRAERRARRDKAGDSQ